MSGSRAYCASAGCSARVRSGSTTGLCRHHLIEKRAQDAAANRRICVADGCTKVLASQAENNLCIDHWHEQRRADRALMAELVRQEMLITRDRRVIARKLGVKLHRVNDLAKEFAPPRPVRMLSDIVFAAAAHAGLTVEDVTGKSRAVALVRARHAVCLIAGQEGHSNPAIGRALGGRDHTTIMHARQAAEERAAREPEYAEYVERVRSGNLPEPAPAEPVPAPAEVHVKAEDESAPEARKLGPICPICQDIVARVTARMNPPRRIRPKNDFLADEDEDESHKFHRGIAAGSSALLAAINLARST